MRDKKIYIGFGIIVLILAGYWLISPIWRVKIADDQLPGLTEALEKMSAEDKEDFMQAMEETKDAVLEMNDAMASSPTILTSGKLIESAHSVAGSVKLIDLGAEKVLRFENLEVTQGPDVRIYLSAGKNIADSVDLGPMKANRGNVNYDIPLGTDTSKYRHVLIWCRAFSVLFSYAELK